MREGFDKEIDSLLRRTARAPAGARGNGAGASVPDSHLDADELSAFTEGALPEAARMNAVLHLADCGECRVRAVNLTRAAGVEAELEKSAAAAASSSTPSKAHESGRARGWLATLFAPRTLRYVAPALVICLVAVVSFIAIRARRDGSVAQLEPSNAGARPSIAASQENTQPSSEGLMNSNSSANANTATIVTGMEESPSSDKGSAGAPMPKPETKDAKEDAPDGSAASERAKEKSPGDDDEVASPPPAKKTDDAPASVAPAPTEMEKSAPVDSPSASKSGEHMKAGPPPPAQTNDELASNEASQQKQQRGAQPRNLEPQSPDGGSRARAGSAANNAVNGGALAAPSARRERSAQDERRDADRSDAAEESRSVAGHRFRREGGSWVDVNYKPSMALSGVRRGTDHYRSLVADIPELGRIAEQLGGEAIVVVRGRAYRIQ
ncbi:MAG: hypothetical protein ACJ74Q_11060 [Pyrinomonadaceae bacterium]